MKIVHSIFSMSAKRGGPTYFLRDLSEAQAATGAEVALVTGSETSSGGRILPDPGLCQVVTVPNSANLYFPTLQFGHAIGSCLAGGQSILHDHGIWLPSNLLAAQAASAARRPYIVSPHGTLNDWAFQWHGKRKKIVWWLYQRRILANAAVIVATSDEERSAIAAKVPGRATALIPNGVHAPSVCPDRSHLLGRASKRILFMSRLHPKKNLAGLVDAWALVSPDFADWTLVVAGPDELGERQAAELKLRRYGLTHTVEFTGPVAEADRMALFADCDAFILPSFSENFGIVVAEALGHGLPVIATVGTPWQELDDLGIGTCVQPDPDSLSAAMRWLMTKTDAERLAMSAIANQHVRNRYSWDHIAALTLQLYEWVTHGGSRPSFVDG